MNRHSLVALVVALALTTSVRVAAQSLPMGWQLQQSGDTITVTIEAFDVVQDVDVHVRNHRDGRTYDFDLGDVGLGETAPIEFPAPARTSDYTLAVTGTFANIPGRIEDRFEISVAEPVAFDLDTSTFDEERRYFEITMTQPAGAVELLVRGESGDVLADTTVEFDGERAGTRLPVTWTQRDESILTIDVRAYSTTGEWASRSFVPWSVEFSAHVNFPTASWEIPEEDVPMLAQHLRDLRERAEAVAEWVTCNLYIAGYTDTVGSNSDNQRLSEQRARSIGRFFRSRGLDLEIYYQGFGEEALAVPTADNVDAPQNRRSVFILQPEEPTGADVPGSNWRPLD